MKQRNIIDEVEPELALIGTTRDFTSNTNILTYRNGFPISNMIKAIREHVVIFPMNIKCIR